MSKGWSFGALTDALKPLAFIDGTANTIAYFPSQGVANITPITALARTVLSRTTADQVWVDYGLDVALAAKQPKAPSLTTLSKVTLTDNAPHIILNSQAMSYGGNFEGARFLTVGGLNANRQFALGITTPTAPAGNTFTEVGNTFGQLAYTDVAGTVSVWKFDQGGSAFCTAPGGQWVNTSDKRIKYNMKSVQNALNTMLKLHGSTWLYKDSDKFGMGLLAQEVYDLFPDAIERSIHTTADGTVIDDLMNLNAGNVIAAITPEAFREMYSLILELQREIAELKSV